MMPRAFSSGVKDASFVSTPRGLNEPVRCSSSAFRNVSGPSVRHERSGVRWRRPRITAAACSTSARSTIARSYDLHQNGPRGERGATPGPARRARRPRAQPPDRVLPALSRDPPVPLGRAARNRRVRRRLRELARRADPGRGAGQPPRLRRELHPLLDAGRRVRVPRRQPVPVVPRSAGLSRRRRDRSARTPGTLGRLLPAAPRDPGAAHRDRARRRLRDRLVGSGLGDGVVARRPGGLLAQRVVGRRRGGGSCVPRVVRDHRARKCAQGASRPDRVHPRLRGAGGGVPLPSHAALPDVRPGALRAVLGASGAPGSDRGRRRPRVGPG